MDQTITKAAQRIRDAYSGETIAPLRDLFDGTDKKTAYAIQSFNARFWQDQGRRAVGRKIGLTSRAVQIQLDVDQPDFGILFEDMQVANGSHIDSRKLIQPRAETEIAFIMADDCPDGAVSAKEIIEKVQFVAPAVEIVDSRISDWTIAFADTVADNGSAGMFVLGDRVSALDLDLWSCGMVMEMNGSVRSLGAGAACLGHPANAALWLANLLAERGDPLKAGDIVLTGALGPMVPLAAGDHVRATIGGIGTVSFDYGRKP